MERLTLEKRRDFRRDVLGISEETEKRWAACYGRIAAEMAPQSLPKVVVANGAYEVLLFGEVVDDAWAWLFGEDEAVILPGRVNKLLADVREQAEPGATVRGLINSPGGDLWAGINVSDAFDRLAEDGYKTEMLVSGIAASAATIIMMAGQDIAITSQSQTMVHAPMTYFPGGMVNRAAIPALRARLDKVDENLARSENGLVEKYAERNRKGLTVKDISPWVLGDAETWMDAKTNIERGFADRIPAPPKTKAEAEEATENAIPQRVYASAWNNMTFRSARQGGQP